jgi:hypothetical protein
MLGGKGTPRTVLGSPSYLVVWHCHDVQGSTLRASTGAVRLTVCGTDEQGSPRGH